MFVLYFQSNPDFFEVKIGIKGTRDVIYDHFHTFHLCWTCSFLALFVVFFFSICYLAFLRCATLYHFKMDTIEFTKRVINEAIGCGKACGEEFIRDEIAEWVCTNTLVTIIFDDNVNGEDGPIMRDNSLNKDCKKGPVLPVNTERLNNEFSLELELDIDFPEMSENFSSQDMIIFSPEGPNPHLWKYMSKIELVIPENFMQPIFRQKSVFQAFIIFSRQLQENGDNKNDFQSILPGLIARFKTLEKYSMLIPAFVDMNLQDFHIIFNMIRKNFFSEKSNKKRKVE